MNSHPETHAAVRRYDLDWLRVFAFSLLIFYHIGMLYVERWGFHFKSAYTSTFLENIMLLANPWRMALLWMISGVATSYLLNKFRWWEFLGQRSVRLLLPLALGVWVIVPPQLFVEMSANGDFSGTYPMFYRAFLDLESPQFTDYSAGIWPHVDVNHLWYLRELWTFTLLLIVALPLLNWVRTSELFQRVMLPLGSISVLLSAPLILTGVELAVFPDLGTEGRRKALGLSFFLLGYLLTHQERVWRSLCDSRHLAAALALLAYSVYLAAYHLVWLQNSNGLSTTQATGMILLDHLMRWFCLCAVFGFAVRYLNRRSPWLTYLSPGVYPFYLVHQTVILLAAFYLADLSLGPVIEPIFVIVTTICGCLLTYELVRRVPLLRPIFGLKLQDPPRPKPQPAWRRYALAGLAAVIVVPLGFEILV